MKHILDSNIALRSTIARKAISGALKGTNRIRAGGAENFDRGQGPFLVNSIPKSGTHLLLQVARELPGALYLGSHVSWASSMTLKERSPAAMRSRLRRLTEREVAGGHVYYHPSIADYMDTVGIRQLFIFRDPRDVLISEANYLANMRRWHRLHSVMKKSTESQRLEMLLDGIPGVYDGLSSRIERFIGWLALESVWSVKYEDLIGGNQREVLEDLVKWAEQKGAAVENHFDLVSHMQNAIDPKNSHTFAGGGVGKWRRQLPEAMRGLVNDRLGAVVSRLGYS